MINDTKDEKGPSEPKDEVKAEAESAKEPEKIASTSSASDSSPLVSTRNDLIKDIESHIEIIYECLDELNDTGTSSTLNKTAPIELTTSSEASSQEADKTVKEMTEIDGEKANDLPAQESKTE